MFSEKSYVSHCKKENKNLIYFFGYDTILLIENIKLSCIKTVVQ